MDVDEQLVRAPRMADEQLRLGLTGDGVEPADLVRIWRPQIEDGHRRVDGRRRQRRDGGAGAEGRGGGRNPHVLVRGSNFRVGRSGE